MSTDHRTTEDTKTVHRTRGLLPQTWADNGSHHTTNSDGLRFYAVEAMAEWKEHFRPPESSDFDVDVSESITIYVRYVTATASRAVVRKWRGTTTTSLKDGSQQIRPLCVSRGSWKQFHTSIKIRTDPEPRYAEVSPDHDQDIQRLRELYSSDTAPQSAPTDNTLLDEVPAPPQP